MRTKIWSEVWCENETFMTRFNRLSILESHKMSFVNEYWDGQAWVLSWRKEIKGGGWIGAICSIPKSFIRCSALDSQDKYVWELDNSEIFTATINRIKGHMLSNGGG